MNLDNLQQVWQQQALPSLDIAQLSEKTQRFAKQVQKQNRKVIFTLGGTVVYLLVIGGVFLREIPAALLMVGLVIALLIYQAVILQRRKLALERSLEAQPKAHIEQLIQKLRYNLRVSRLHMPIYGVLLGSLISIYTWIVLLDTPNWIKALVVGGTLLLMLLIFVWGMRRQYHKDQTELIPMIKELEQLAQQYQES
ncbi:MAG: hypothetical protein AAGM67_11870 [Bacteroidota bacterium]